MKEKIALALSPYPITMRLTNSSEFVSFSFLDKNGHRLSKLIEFFSFPESNKIYYFNNRSEIVIQDLSLIKEIQSFYQDQFKSLGKGFIDSITFLPQVEISLDSLVDVEWVIHIFMQLIAGQSYLNLKREGILQDLLS